jgi:hypothetical protein
MLYEACLLKTNASLILNDNATAPSFVVVMMSVTGTL